MKSGAVKSAARAMQVFEIFERSARGMRLSEITEAMGIPQSSASVLLKTLSEMGFIDFDPDTRNYSPSVRVALLGTWVLGKPTVTGDVLAVVKRIYQETGQTVGIAVQNGLRVQYVHLMESSEVMRFTVNPGVSRPIHKAALGIVLLSLKADDEILRMLRHWNSMNTDTRLVANSDDVLEMVTNVRTEGYIRTDGLWSPNAGVLAVPLIVGDKVKPLALGIGAHTEILRENEASYLSTISQAVQEFHKAN
jgi:DNA-binding IclR family transcriptional regulator